MMRLVQLWRDLAHEHAEAEQAALKDQVLDAIVGVLAIAALAVGVVLIIAGLGDRP